MKTSKPKRGQEWTRNRTGLSVTVLAVVNPYGESPPYVVVEADPVGLEDTGRVTAVRLDRFTKDYVLVK